MSLDDAGLTWTHAVQAKRGMLGQPELHHGRQLDCEGALSHKSLALQPSCSTDMHLPFQAAIDGVGAKAGSPLTLARFVRLRVGDGIDKEEKDFAAEVAAAARV